MKTLHAYLTEETELIEAFLQLLDEEAGLLTSGAFGDLPALTERKSNLIEKIETLDHKRETREALLGAAGKEPGVQQAWKRLLEVAALAQERNHRNGVMIHAHLDYTRQSIGFLRSRNSQPLYGPDGEHTMPGGSRNSLATG